VSDDLIAIVWSWLRPLPAVFVIGLAAAGVAGLVLRRRRRSRSVPEPEPVEVVEVEYAPRRLQRDADGGNDTPLAARDEGKLGR
jgi:MYXO-CTERM domain-containing protein